MLNYFINVKKIFHKEEKIKENYLEFLLKENSY